MGTFEKEERILMCMVAQRAVSSSYPSPYLISEAQLSRTKYPPKRGFDTMT